MLGAIIGDIIGSPYEFKNTSDVNFPLFNEKSRFTDDTVCSCAIAAAILDGSRDYAGHMRRLCVQYPGAGYGKSFASWLESVDYGGYGSWGNGSGMRISPVPFMFSPETDLEVVFDEVRKATEITHNSVEGFRAAEAIAGSIHLIRRGWDKEAVKAWLVKHTGYNLNRTCVELNPYKKFDVSAEGSTPHAIIAFLEGTDFEDCIRKAVLIGGDVDTIAAMTGSLAHAMYPVPKEIVDEAVKRLDGQLATILLDFYEKYC